MRWCFLEPYFDEEEDDDGEDEDVEEDEAPPSLEVFGAVEAAAAPSCLLSFFPSLEASFEPSPPSFFDSFFDDE